MAAVTSSLSIDELAEASGVPSRTIRFYRQSGLIDPPERIGRQAFYNDEHLARLRTVAGLRAQGLSLDAIAKVWADPAGSRESFAPLLEIGRELRHPWVEDREAVMTESEVLSVAGIDNPAVLSLLEQYAVISQVPNSRPARYLVPSVDTMVLAVRLTTLGVAPELVNQAWTAIQRHLTPLAGELLELFAAQPTLGFAGWPSPDQVGQTFTEIQAAAVRAVEIVFAREMKAALDAFVEGGGVFEVNRRTISDG